jgi:hypothetical protein
MTTEKLQNNEEQIEEYKNFFLIPHLFIEQYAVKYSIATSWFYIILKKHANRFADNYGWFIHKDLSFLSRKKDEYGFKKYKLTKRACIKARKELKTDRLIDTRYKYNKNGRRIGTEYRITDPHLYIKSYKPK